MLRIGSLKNKYQKRLIRPLYAQTQATPYAAVLDASLRTAGGDFNLPGAAFKLKSGLVPGTVMTNLGDAVTVATGANPGAGTGQTFPGPIAFGLLANFVGGELNDIGDENFVGVWRGPDSVYEILAPGFDDTGLSAAWSASTTGNPVPLYSGADGRLTQATNLAGAVAGNRQVVAYLIERPSASRIVVDLKV